MGESDGRGVGVRWVQCARSERLLIIGISALIALIIGLTFVILHHHSLVNYECTDVICIVESSKLIRRINQKAKPCIDFYQFVCKHKDFDQPKKQIVEELDAIMHTTAKNDSAIVMLTKELYRGCINQTVNLVELGQMMKIAGGWPILEGSSWTKNFNWLEATLVLNRLGLPHAIFLGLTVEEDLLTIAVPPISSSSFQDTKYWVRLATEFGTTESVAEDALLDIYKFFNANRMIGYNEELISVYDLQARCNEINWLYFLQSLTGKKILSNTTIIADTLQIRNRLRILTQTTKETLANYMMWMVVDKLLPFLPHRLALLKSAGITKWRQGFCVQILEDKFLLNSIETLHSQQYLDKSKKEEVTAFVKTIAETYTKVISANGWIKLDHKQQLTAKIRNITVVIGSNEEVDSDRVALNSQQMVNGSSFLQLLAKASHLHNHILYSGINKNKFPSWRATEPQYFRAQNTIRIPTIAASKMFYNEERPNYINYGSFGSLISYQFAKIVMEGIGEGIFKNRSSCQKNFTTQYGKVHETLLDAMALQLSRKAYDNWVTEHHKESSLIGTRYEPNQLFWISASSLLCKSADVQEILYSIPEFLKDFQCAKNGSNICGLLL